MKIKTVLIVPFFLLVYRTRAAWTALDLLYMMIQLTRWVYIGMELAAAQRSPELGAAWALLGLDPVWTRRSRFEFERSRGDFLPRLGFGLMYNI